MITSQLFPVVQQMSAVDSKINYQSTCIWGIIGVISITTIIIAIIILVMYKSSGKFFSKIFDLRDQLAAAVQQFKIAVETRSRLNQLRPPPTHPKPKFGMSYHLPSRSIGFGIVPREGTYPTFTIC